jgi:hypothetical protein
MTGPPPASPPPGDLPARLFRALYQGYDLHPAGGTWFAVPKGTACYAAPTIGEIAGQISAREHPAPDPPAGVSGPGSMMTAPGLSLLPPPAAAPGRAAAALTRALTARGITGIITAAAQEFSVISVTADVTIWTDGTRLWCTIRGQRSTWPAADTEAAAADIAALTA